MTALPVAGWMSQQQQREQREERKKTNQYKSVCVTDGKRNDLSRAI